MKDYATSLGKKATGEELAGRPTGIVDTGKARDISYILETSVPNIRELASIQNKRESDTHR